MKFSVLNCLVTLRLTDIETESGMSVIPKLNGFFLPALREYTSTKHASIYGQNVATAGQGSAGGPIELLVANEVGMLQ